MCEVLDIEDFLSEFQKAESEISKDADERQRLRETMKATLKAARKAQADAEASKVALETAQTLAKHIQDSAHKRVADIVSRSLAAVFSEPYEFKITFTEKRGHTEASLTFERDGKQFDPMSSTGGGVVAVAAIALRISALLLSNPPVRRLLVLDEPLVHPSKEYTPRIRELIEKLAEEFDIQILLVTHLEDLVCGQVVRL